MYNTWQQEQEKNDEFTNYILNRRQYVQKLWQYFYRMIIHLYTYIAASTVNFLKKAIYLYIESSRSTYAISINTIKHLTMDSNNVQDLDKRCKEALVYHAI